MARRDLSFHKIGLTQRQRQVGEEVRHLLASLLRKDFWEEEILMNCSLTVSEVRMSADLKHAFAFVMPLGGRNTKEVIEALNRSASQLRHQLGKSLHLRSVPSLRFELDSSFETAGHIENLLRSPHVAQDLENSNE